MENKDWMILLVGISGTIIAFFGAFILNIAVIIKNKNREIDFEIGLVYKELLKKRSEVPKKTIEKILQFETEHIEKAVYLEGRIDAEDIKYTTQFDYYKINKLKKKWFLRYMVRNLYEFILFSKNFEYFSNNANISTLLKKSSDFREIYEFVKKFQSIENYVDFLEEELKTFFTKEELEQYLNYMRVTEMDRDKLWNLIVLKPSFKNELLYFVGILYVCGIAFLGVFEPLYYYRIGATMNHIPNVFSIFFLSIIYIALCFIYAFVPTGSRRRNKQLSNYFNDLKTR